MCPNTAWKIPRKGPLVWSAPKISVDSIATTATAIATGHQALTQRPTRRLLDMIVRSFARDDHVVHMALAQTRARDAYELRLLLQFLDGRATQVAHAGLQSADQLVHHRFQRSAIWH